MQTLKLKEDLYWVGSLDPELRVFDIIMFTKFGTTYNSYVVKGSEKIALIETVKLRFFDEYIEKLKEVNINIDDVDYIIVNHTEPDHTGAIEKLLKMNPKIQLVGSKQAIDYLNFICNTEFNSKVVKDGDELSLGNKTFRFYDAKFLHWPDTIFTYLVEDKILFTCDAFGAHYALDTVLKSTVKNKEEYMEAFKYYFDNILYPFKTFFVQAIEKIENLDIDMICTGHGPILDENPWENIQLSKQYSLKEKPFEGKLVVIPYASAYGYTKEIADNIAKAIKDEKIDVEMYDMVYEEKDKVLERIYWADGVLFGSPTMVGDAVEPIWRVLNSMNPIIHKGKAVSAFGSYGWSGEAVPNIIQRLKQLRLKTVGEGLKVRFKSSKEELQAAYDFGVEFVNAISQNSDNKSAIIKKEEKEKEKEVIKSEVKTYRWKCTVCGEIIESETVPAVCPVCGVGPEYFVKLEDEEVGEFSDKKENIIIIGASGAGMYAAIEIRKRNKVSDLTVISKEDVKGYFRPQLSKLLGNDDVTIESMVIKDDKWFKENNVNLLLDKLVEKIDTANKKVILNDGKELGYTKLIIASGAEVFVPPFPGKEKQGVFTLRYAKDGKEIKEYAKSKKTGAVIGGGVLGLEAANELKKLGLDVTVIEVADRILPRQLDKDASEVLEEALRSFGVNFKKGVGTKEIIGGTQVKGILLDNGEVVEAELVIVSTGVKANSKIAEGSGIEIKRAIVVNEKMETTAKDVFACGDCAEFNGINYALWSEATEQGKTAGINAVGGNSVYENIIPSTTLNAFGISVFSIGDVGSNPEKEYKTYKSIDRKNYKKLYFVNEILSGGILIGDTSQTVDLIEGIEKSKNMDEMIEKFK